MRIVYIGNFQPEFSTENDVRKAFESLGHTVIKLQENETNVAVVKAAMQTADMLLITSTWDQALPLEGMLDIYHYCAFAGKPTATLHLDTFWGKDRGGREWWKNPMFHSAYIFTADGDYDDMWKALGRNHIWLPPAVRHDAAHFGKFREEYACDVAFVGSNGAGYHEDVWGYRKELVDRLRDMCWRKKWTFRNPGGDDPKVDRGEDMNDFYASASVTVGDSLCLKKNDSRYWSDRVPEATGRGGFLIMPAIAKLSETWDLPQYGWGNWQQLEGQIQYWLEHEEERREVVKKNQTITAVEHTYVNRVRTILERVGL